MATGTITPGISEAFAAEVAKRGDYIKTVVLNSPGGSVTDALAMGRLIREKNFATEVEAGKYCASSCPLVFAGGVERRAGDKAAIGVHQVAAIGQRRQPRRATRWTWRRTSRRGASAISATWASTCRSGCMPWRRRTTSCSSSSRMN